MFHHFFSDVSQCLYVVSFSLPTGYVGLGTVGAATWWYLFDDEGPQVTFYQLVRFKALVSSVRLSERGFDIISKPLWVTSGDPASVQK